MAALWDGFNASECEAQLWRQQSGRRVLSFEAVAARALASAVSTVPAMLPGGRHRGTEWVSRNPTWADRHAGSFSVNLHTCKWADSANGDTPEALGNQLTTEWPSAGIIEQTEGARHDG